MLHIIPTWLFIVPHVKTSLVPIVTRMILFGPYVYTHVVLNFLQVPSPRLGGYKKS
jgi:hypothetical protein